MDEAEWLSCTDPIRMLRACRRVIRNHPRKARLFAVACCYRIWHLLTDQRSREAVETAARYADGLVSETQLKAAAVAARAAYLDAFREKGEIAANAAWAADFATDLYMMSAVDRACNSAFVAAGDGPKPGPEHTAQSHLLRCVFGPLAFRSVVVGWSWLTWNDGLVVNMANAVYDDRLLPAGHLDPARLAVLADALDDAGCTDLDILAHCRDGGPHVRGCWVLDLLLGKS
jgi:hypothetical protein